jgi:hypothetical protein
VKKQSSPVVVALSAPTLSHSVLAVGASATITVTVTLEDGIVEPGDAERRAGARFERSW